MPAKVFRTVLRRLAAAQEMGLEDLARALDLKDEEKKWLRRLWERGLVRPDKRRRPLLRRLARFLGLRSELDLWKPDADVQPKQFARSNKEEWQRLVTAVAEALAGIDMVSRYRPGLVSSLEKLYGGREGCVAEWARSRYLSKPDDKPIARQVTQIAEEWRESKEFYSCDAVQQRVLGRFSKHPGWPKVRRILNEMFDGDEDKIAKQVLVWYREAVERPPTEDEIVERICTCHLGWIDGRTTGDLRWKRIYAELQEHPTWFEYLERSHDNNESAALHYVRDAWQAAINRSGGKIPPDLFIHNFKDTFLDPLRRDVDVSEPKKSE